MRETIFDLLNHLNQLHSRMQEKDAAAYEKNMTLAEMRLLVSQILSRESSRDEVAIFRSTAARLHRYYRRSRRRSVESLMRNELFVLKSRLEKIDSRQAI